MMSSPVALVSTRLPDLSAVAVMPVVDDCALTASANADKSDVLVMVAEIVTDAAPVSVMVAVPALTPERVAVVVALALTPVAQAAALMAAAIVLALSWLLIAIVPEVAPLPLMVTSWD